MKTIKSITFTVNTDEPLTKVIDRKAIENGYTDNKDIYSNDGFDCTWEDQFGNTLMSGYRLHPDRTKRIEITVVNTWPRINRDIKQKLLYINND